MKKVLSLVLVLTLVLGSFSLSFAAPSDVVGTEYEDAVERLLGLGIITGYPNGNFGPEDTITREQFAAVVVRAKGLEAAAQAAMGATDFADVPAGSWSSGYINIATKMGLIKGTGAGNFEPLRPVTYEEAIAMVLRALNYEEFAQSRGGWPYGYIIVANEIDLLDAVKGVQGLPASRGLVAQLVDNSLEIPMMVQIGVGAQALWVVSGTQNTEEVTLLDEVGFKNVEGVVSIVSQKKGTIKVGDTTLVAPEGFDFNFHEGLTIKAWYTGSNIATFVVKNEAKYDAVQKVDEDTIKLVGENKAYDLVEGLEAQDADYAKVVLNSDGEIAFVKYYDLDFMVVEEVEDGIVYDLNDDELDVEDYLITKDGKTITVDDLELGDILFFDYANDFAVVYNNSEVGEIERIYDNSVKVSGTVYDIAEKALYLDGTTLDTLSSTVLGDMMDEDGEVELYFNHAGDVVLVEGDTGEEVVTTSSFYGYLAGDSKPWIDEVRGTEYIYWTFDVVNQEGKTVKDDLSHNFVSNLDSKGQPLADSKKTYVGTEAWYTGTIDFDDLEGSLANLVTKMTDKTPVKVTLDEDGEVIKVEKLSSIVQPKADFKVTATKVTANDNKDYKLQSSTLVFYKNSLDKNQVIKFGDIDDEFEKITTAAEMYVANGRVVAIFVYDKDDVLGAPVTNTEFVGLLTWIRDLSSGKVEFTLEVAGKEEVFVTADTLSLTETQKEDLLNKIVKVEVSDVTGDMVLFDADGDSNSDDYYKVFDPVAQKLDSRSTVSGTIAVDDDNNPNTASRVYELNEDAVIYDENYKVIGLRDLNAGDKVKVYTEGNSPRFVDYVIRTEKASEGDTPPVDLVETTVLKDVTASGTTVTAEYDVNKGDSVEFRLYSAENVLKDFVKVAAASADAEAQTVTLTADGNGIFYVKLYVNGVEAGEMIVKVQ